MAPMSVIDHDDINYQVKLAVTCQLEETLDEKAIETLVEEPKKEAMGGTKKNPKENPKAKGNQSLPGLQFSTRNFACQGTQGNTL